MKDYITWENFFITSGALLWALLLSALASVIIYFSGMAFIKLQDKCQCRRHSKIARASRKKNMAIYIKKPSDVEISNSDGHIGKFIEREIEGKNNDTSNS
jgi:hypothetical protein